MSASEFGRDHPSRTNTKKVSIISNNRDTHISEDFVKPMKSTVREENVKIYEGNLDDTPVKRSIHPNLTNADKGEGIKNNKTDKSLMQSIDKLHISFEESKDMSIDNSSVSPTSYKKKPRAGLSSNLNVSTEHPKRGAQKINAKELPKMKLMELQAPKVKNTTHSKFAPAHEVKCKNLLITI